MDLSTVESLHTNELTLNTAELKTLNNTQIIPAQCWAYGIPFSLTYGQGRGGANTLCRATEVLQ